MKIWETSIATSVLAMSMCSIAPAFAQADDVSTGLSEVVVTATRREANVQDTPLPVTALSGDSLRDRGIVDPRQLSSLAPSLLVDQGLGEGQTHISIRGQSSNSFFLDAQSPAAIYIDEVYQPYQYGLTSQIFDMSRIEVLRGPQGTLFGKNTTAGSVSYYTQTPVFADEGYLSVEGGGGDFTHYGAEGAWNVQLAENVAFRASVRADARDAYIDNLFDGEELGQSESYNARFQLRLQPSEDTDINLKLFAQTRSGDGPQYNSRGYYADPCAGFLGPYFACDGGEPTPLSDDTDALYSEVPTSEDWNNLGMTLRVDQALGDSTLTSITNYQSGDYGNFTNDDGMAGDFFHSNLESESLQYSQELRLATPEDSALRAIFGLYGQYDEIDASLLSLSDGATLNGVRDPTYDFTQSVWAETHTTSLAAFVSGTYDFTPRLTVTLGARYSWEKKEAVDFLLLYNNNFDGSRTFSEAYFDRDFAESQYNPVFDVRSQFSDSETFSALTGDLRVSYKATDDVLVFAGVANGFRSGGFFRGTEDVLPEFFVALEPEEVVSYEAGFKSEWLDHSLRVNGTIFFSDYTNMQVQVANLNGPGLGFSNASEATIQGAELEIQYAPIERLVISSSVGYTDATYDEYDTAINHGGVIEPVSLAGFSLPYAPELTANLGLTYSFPVSANHDVTFDTNWNYRSKIYLDAFNFEEVSDPARVLGDVRLAFGASDKSWDLAGYVNNVTDEDVIAFTYLLGSIAPTIYAPGRSFGLRLSMRY